VPAAKERRHNDRVVIVAAFANEVRARIADLGSLLEAIDGDPAEASRYVRAAFRQVAMLDTATEGLAVIVAPPPPELRDIQAAQIDRALRAFVAESGGGPVKPCRVILADLEAEAVAFMARLARVALASRFPFDAEARLVLRDAAAMFLPGESSDAADRAVRDRIEAVVDAVAEMAEAVENLLVSSSTR
jgi:hypothetical protein